MKMKPFASLVFCILSFFAMSVFCSAQQESILWDMSFNGSVGLNPTANLVRDARGNLYGTTGFGGPKSGGTVFELKPGSNGTWTPKVLYAYLSINHDGQRPMAGLTFDAAGHIYGTTLWGGLYNQGTVFELMREPNGSWRQKQLHSFGGAKQDGLAPQAGVIFDRQGNLYGTTTSGGEYNFGTVYELIPQSDGTWKEKILHAFNLDGIDGYTPIAGLVMDRAGNLYGGTVGGGPGIVGIVFELSPKAQGQWKETILHNFDINSTDGNSPFGTLIFDGSGNLYGTTYSGGVNGLGTAFELSPAGDGTWSETILHNFGAAGDGETPYSSLIFDASGNLYGTTEYGGTYNLGTVFELSPQASGVWSETLLHNFGSGSADGNYPLGSLIFDPSGNLYGMTDTGGSGGYGTVYEITP